MERYPQPRCHPDTRAKMLDDLWNWACGTEPQRNHNDSDSANRDWTAESHPSSRILWLYGPAGCGKTCVAQTLCQKLQVANRLGGSFFFKRGHPSRGNAKKLFPTIAYQLTRLHPQLNSSISRTIEEDPAIVDRSLSLQLQQLILEPCHQASLTTPICVLVDGLDECEGQNIQGEILRAISQTIHNPHIPILFFIASRPEAHIREGFGHPSLDKFHSAMNVQQSFADVRKYLQDEFSRIHQDHQTMATVSFPWPSTTVLDRLVQKSSGYFIYASTVIKFVDDKDFHPSERLDAITGISTISPEDEAPFWALDQLYIQILSLIRPAVRSRLLPILAASLLHGSLDAHEIGQLLELQPGRVALALRGLHSVLEINIEGRICIYHASFRDFLIDPTRSGEFCVDSVHHHTYLTTQILKAWTYNPEKAPTVSYHVVW
ncbi:hypothetical protein DFH07DRAFT_925433 [Mycena maculata]|uniref:Nephrocystin 3-like N-terminal domain-containing protein n=1 Tax=Mycena maculata TaxID=230809 RepID=A0AAD7IH60_9AGAR|nr:hypothetical protein DFH07DRAFT_925433 [Mycena maculata]